MKTMKRIIALLMAVLMLAALTACGNKIDVDQYEQPKAEEKPAASATESAPADGAAPAEGETAAAPAELSYPEGTVLRMATGYNSTKTGLFFDAEVAGEGVTLANGVTYNAGDLKPTWVEVEKILGVKFENQYQGNSAAKEFEYWRERMSEVDMVSGTASGLTEFGEQGVVVNIAEYLDQMPNFKAYLDQNPIVRLSITGNTSTGAIYFSPYFDGVNDIERMPLMRVDMVKKLLDGEGEFTAEKSNNTAAPVYQPYMPTSGKIDIETVKADGSGTETVTKDYDAGGNIIAKMNEAGSIDGVTAVNMLRTYIDETYNGYYGTERSNLFCGQNACWDADEMVALLRCVVANPQTLNGTDAIQGLFAREDDNNQRRVDMFRFAGHLFGVRGLESRQDYLYFDVDGSLKDARQDPETFKALERMNNIAKEGLISVNFMQNAAGKTEDYLRDDLAFMHYDYNQTQTLFNDPSKGIFDEGECYMAVMVPVACWQDGTEGGNYMRFTESWRSVKTDGWGISAAGVAGNPDKLNAALKLIDFAYSPEGMILMSYGPKEFIKTNADGSYVTFLFNGQEMPEIADATRAELWEKAGGNYTNYARQFLGSTLSFAKSQAFEYQCTSEIGRLGAGYISNAIALGTIKHPILAVTDNPWYMSVPTVLPNTKAENDMINTFTQLSTNGKFNAAKGGENLFVNQIVSGYVEEGMGNAEAAASVITSEWGGQQYLALKQQAWDRLLVYYNALG